jgi:hypothetical protein
MTDHHPSVPDDLDAMQRAAIDARRCMSISADRRCQLAAVHDGWPHLHTWMEWTHGHTRLLRHTWQWRDGEVGQMIQRGPSDPVPPWTACGQV